MKTAAIYARVSTTDQVKGTSLDGQIESCRKEAQERGYTVVKEITEDFTGTRLDRPGLDQIRGLAQSGQIQTVIVYDPDRLSRRNAHLWLLMDEFERLQIDLIFVNAPRNNTPEGNMLFGMRALFAEYEREKIIERTRRGKERRAREGKILNHTYVPYGYVYNKEGLCYDIYEPEAYWVRKMFSWLVDDHMSLRAITIKLTEEGAPTKQGAKQWASASVWGIIRQPTYVGEWYYNKRQAVEPRNPRKPAGKRVKTSTVTRPQEEWILVPIPAIIDRATFESAQAQLQRNKDLSARRTKRQYLLRGMLFCKHCSYRLTGRSNSRPNGRKHRARFTPERWYQCPGWELRKASPDCPHLWVHADHLEADVWDEVVRQFSDEQELRKHLEGKARNVLEERRKNDAELASLYEAQVGLKREMDKMLDLYKRDLIDEGTLENQLKGIRQRQVGVKNAIEQIRQKAQERETSSLNSETIEHMVEWARLGLPEMPWEERREFLEAMDFTGIVDGNKKRVYTKGLVTEKVLRLREKYSKKARSENSQSGEQPVPHVDLQSEPAKDSHNAESDTLCMSGGPPVVDRHASPSIVRGYH